MRAFEYASSILTHIASDRPVGRAAISRRSMGLTAGLHEMHISTAFQTGTTHMIVAKAGIGSSGLVMLFLSAYLGVIPKRDGGERQNAIEHGSPVR
jgi:hypothetical protein